jgi:5-methylcytosine-specific restriction endonuclease McrA
MKVQGATYRAQNPDKRRANSQKWRAENKDRANALSKATYARNRDVITARARAKFARTAAIEAERGRAYRQANKGKINSHTMARKAAFLQRIPAWLTEDDHWMIEQAYELAALRTKIFGVAWHVDHVLPLRGKTVSGLHTPYNMQVILGSENSRKGNRVQHGE